MRRSPWAALGAASIALVLVPVAPRPAAATTGDPHTDLVDLTSVGTAGNGGADTPPSLSDDGRYVAFVSYSTDLLATPDTNERQDVFWRDMETGTTQMVNVTAAGAQIWRIGGGQPSISADGRYVAFTTNGSLRPTDANSGDDVYVRDMVAGTVERASVDTGPDDNDVPCCMPNPSGGSEPSISADGRYVAFRTESKLDPVDANGVADVYVRDRANETTRLASVDSAGALANNAASTNCCNGSTIRGSFAPSISGDGAHLAFVSAADNLVAGDTNGWVDVFAHDVDTGVTERLDVTVDGAQSTGAIEPSMNQDGSVVAFTAHGNLDATPIFDCNATVTTSSYKSDVFVRDRTRDATERISIAPCGGWGYEWTTSSSKPSISSNGRFVAFESSSNTVAQPQKDTTEVFVRDRGVSADGTVHGQAQTVNAAIADDGTLPDKCQNVYSAYCGGSYSPSVSDNGKWIAFVSDNRDLAFPDADIAKDANGVMDVFLRYRGNQAPTAVITADRTHGEAPVSVHFDGTGSRDPEDGTDLTYEWEINGYRFGGPTLDWSFTLPTYVYLNVYDTEGAGGRSEIRIDVDGPLSLPPTVCTSISPLSGRAPLTVTLDESCSTSNGGDPLSYDWLVLKDLAWFAAPRGATTTLTLTEPGTYQVIPSVCNSDGGCGSSLITDITVTPGAEPPTATLDKISSTTPWPGGVVVLQATGADSDGSVVAFEWDANGDGAVEQTTTLPEAAATATATTAVSYPGPGTFTPAVRSLDDQGNRSAWAIKADVHVGDPACTGDADGDGVPCDLDPDDSDPADGRPLQRVWLEGGGLGVLTTNPLADDWELATSNPLDLSYLALFAGTKWEIRLFTGKWLFGNLDKDPATTDAFVNLWASRAGAGCEKTTLGDLVLEEACDVAYLEGVGIWIQTKPTLVLDVVQYRARIDDDQLTTEMLDEVRLQARSPRTGRSFSYEGYTVPFTGEISVAAAPAE